MVANVLMFGLFFESSEFALWDTLRAEMVMLMLLCPDARPIFYQYG